MDMKKVSKMEAHEIENELVKVQAGKPKLLEIKAILNKRIQEAKDDIVLGDEPRYDIKELEGKLDEINKKLFEIEKFERLLPTLVQEAKNRTNRARDKKAYDEFVKNLAKAAKLLEKDKEIPAELKNAIMFGRKTVLAQKALYKLGLK